MKLNGKEKYYLSGYEHHPLSFARRLESFRHAFRGLFDVLRTEPNAWVHSICTVLVLALAFWLQIRSTPFCFLLIAIVAVWITEIFNTVLEIVVDIASPEYSEMAKRAKDIAASAVLIAAMGAAALGLVIFAPAIQKRFAQEAHAGEVVVMKLTVTSPAFQGDIIPKKYTCDGADLSPPLEWSTPPEGTKSLALISDDPDATIGTWVHWLVYNMPPDVTSLPEGVKPDATLTNGGSHGTTDFRRFGYGGPCPPKGTHRYFFKLYALDTKLGLKPGATKKQILEAMKGHVLAEGELIGKYNRSW